MPQLPVSLPGPPGIAAMSDTQGRQAGTGGRGTWADDGIGTTTQ